MGAVYQKIWFEKLLPDYVRARIVDVPSSTIIQSATSNYQRSPRALVLLEGKYHVTDVISVSVTRSRTVASNTATITILNVDNRYSAANKEKISVNIPVSIYFGFEGEYIQNYEGFIDTTSMTTDANGSIITITCRDRAKKFLDQKISGGPYSNKSEYLGYSDWHFRISYNIDGELVKLPRMWNAQDILTDICYRMGLIDLKEYISVVETELPNGTFRYDRVIKYGPEFDLQLDPKLNVTLVTNFVDANPLDCLAKVCQSILHEVLFDTNGRLVVRPVKKSSDAPVFYMKEERDIASITEDTNDDNLINVVKVIGQTAEQSSLVYPFAPVAVKDKIALQIKVQ